MRKGFTLIELLAVIIILAIVALIATPIILNVVEDARKSAGLSEANMIVSGINNYCATAEIKTELDGSVNICADGVTLDEAKSMMNLGNANLLEVSYNGNKVTYLKVESNTHTYTLCNDGTFAVDNEQCKILTYQSHYINYGGAYNDSFNEGIVTSDDGYVAVGSTNSKNIVGLETSDSTVNDDALIVKYDASGNVIWQDTFGGTNADYFSDIIEVEENGEKYYIAAGYSGSIDGDLDDINVASAYDKPIIAKYDANGNIVNKKIFIDYGGIYGIEKIDNGYIVVGTIDNTTNQGKIYENRINEFKGGWDAVIIQLNNNFEVEWSSYFGGYGNGSTTTGEYFLDFVVTDFGYVTVGFGNTNDGDMADIHVDDDIWIKDAIIVSYDKEGNVLNKNAFGSSGHDEFKSLIEVEDGYIAVGYVNNNDLNLADTGKSGAVIVKYDKSLNFEKYIVVDNNNSNVLNDIILDNDKIIVVGNVLDNNLYTDGIILEITSDLEIVKEERFKGNNSDTFNAIVKKDNSYIVFGSTYSKGNSINDIVDPYLKGASDAILVNYTEDFILTPGYEKLIETELIPKEVVKNYGASIPSYENKDSLKLYTTNSSSEDIGNWCDTTAIHSGERDNYNYAKCLRPFNGSDIVSLYEKTNSQGVSYINGLNDYKMNLNTDKVDLSNNWFRLFFYYNYYPLTEIKLIFNGERYTLEECVELGYIEPLVIYGYNSNDTYINLLVNNSNTVLDGTLEVNLGGNNSRVYVYFKTKTSGFEGISLNFNGTPDNYRSFTLEALRNFEISLSRAE